METVTKQNLHICLTMLTYEKEKEELEAIHIKNKFKK